MLNEFRTQKITWDRANSRLFDPIQTSGGDQNGRRLEVQILNNGEVEDLTGTDLYLAWQTRNKTHSGLEPFDALNASEGIFELYYPTGMLVHAGALRGGLALVDSDGRLVSREFIIQVDRNIVDDEAAESSNEFTALTEALVKINDLEENYAPRLNEVTAQLAQKANETEVRESTDTLPIDVDEMNTRTKQLFTGGSVAVVGENAVGRENIKRKAVSPSETDFIDVEIGVNLFNKNANGILYGKFIHTDGTFRDNEDYLTSDFIEVNPNTEYRVVGNPGAPNRSNVYDGGKQLITVSPQTTNTPHNARFIRIHMLKTQVDNVMLYEYKGVTQPFVPYKEDYKLKDDIKIRKMRTNDIENGQITHEKLAYEELDNRYKEIDSEMGNNYFTETGLVREVGSVILTGQMVAGFRTDGINVDTFSINKSVFQNSSEWSDGNVRAIELLSEFNEPRVNMNQWDRLDSVGRYGLSVNAMNLFVEKGRFANISEVRNYINNAKIEVHYKLAETEILPYLDSFSQNTKEIIDLKLKKNLPLGYEGEDWSVDNG